MIRQILTVNEGSSSLKYSLYEEDHCVWHKNMPRQKNAKDLILKEIKGLKKPLNAIGHRIVFGGSEFPAPVLIDDEVIGKLRKLSRFAPLHMPDEITLIEHLRRYFPDVAQVACFDTSFHQSLPPRAYLFPLPQSLQDEGVRKHGFHGISFESIVDQVKPVPENMIVGHLGSGVSLAAIKNGISVDTTMGLTPLGGVAMGTRPGDLDPGILLYLLQERGYSPDELEHILYFESGLKGLSGQTSDMKTLLKENTEMSKQAIDIFCYQIAKVIGAYRVVLGGLDALIFTGGIGEHCPEILDRICHYLKGIPVPQVFPSQEEKIIAKHTRQIISKH